jgi:hypothetical protein
MNMKEFSDHKYYLTDYANFPFFLWNLNDQFYTGKLIML